ncbi:MAG: hypothetical protein JF886_15030 [Candidatus Dormibacteraeota bacterium]|uniref:Uncharacterized protein n=1 Tax=Candidatus Aeolococcus gillhamiae TaxID=3127015 RepID=A0A934JWB8_9BACT|nr:hypothetical protein [Candidatus Dormibacteraeota bacterium]
MATASTVSVLTEPSPQRVLLYSNDEVGGRDLRRCVALARRLATASPGAQVVLATALVAHTCPRLPRGVSILRLPAVPPERAGAPSRLAPGIIRRARAAIISDVAARFEPDLVVVDRASSGARCDLTAAVAMLAGRGLATRLVIGRGEGCGAVADPRSVGRRRRATSAPARAAA